MEYMTSLQAAEKWNISKRQVNSLCSKGLITGAVMRGNRWMIPADYAYQPNKGKKRFKQPVKYCGKYINIGNEGFRSIRNSEYIDKSRLIGFVLLN